MVFDYKEITLNEQRRIARGLAKKLEGANITPAKIRNAIGTRESLQATNEELFETQIMRGYQDSTTKRSPANITGPYTIGYVIGARRQKGKDNASFQVSIYALALRE